MITALNDLRLATITDQSFRQLLSVIERRHGTISVPIGGGPMSCMICGEFAFKAVPGTVQVMDFATDGYETTVWQIAYDPDVVMICQ